MSRASDRYLRRVGKRLCASRQTKDRLLCGLAGELAEAGDAGYDELVRAFGTPEDAAAELQESVNEAEAAASRSKSRRIAISLGIVAVVPVVTLALFFLRINERTVTIVDRNVAEGTPIISAEETK